MASWHPKFPNVLGGWDPNDFRNPAWSGHDSPVFSHWLPVVQPWCCFLSHLFTMLEPFYRCLCSFFIALAGVFMRNFLRRFFHPIFDGWFHLLLAGCVFPTTINHKTVGPFNVPPDHESCQDTKQIKISADSGRPLLWGLGAGRLGVGTAHPPGKLMFRATKKKKP